MLVNEDVSHSIGLVQALSLSLGKKRRVELCFQGDRGRDSEACFGEGRHLFAFPAVRRHGPKKANRIDIFPSDDSGF